MHVFLIDVMPLFFSSKMFSSWLGWQSLRQHKDAYTTRDGVTRWQRQGARPALLRKWISFLSYGLHDFLIYFFLFFFFEHSVETSGCRGVGVAQYFCKTQKKSTDLTIYGNTNLSPKWAISEKSVQPPHRLHPFHSRVYHGSQVFLYNFSFSSWLSTARTRSNFAAGVIANVLLPLAHVFTCKECIHNARQRSKVVLLINKVANIKAHASTQAHHKHVHTHADFKISFYRISVYVFMEKQNILRNFRV